MSNSIASTEVVPLRPNLVSGGKVAAIVPTSMDEAYRLAKAVCMAGMAPKGLDTPEKAMIAIMHGMEIGLAPMTALQRIAVVNGRPTIWGDGAMSLVRGSGACEWITESVEGKDDARVAICEAKRRGDPKSIRRTFSVADAKKAGLWGKQGPWTQYADRMLQMRARAFCLRDGFADVLGGLYLKEELDDTGAGDAPPTRASAPRTPPALPMATIAAPIAGDAKPKTPPNPNIAPASGPTVESVIAEFKRAIDAATDEDGVNAAWDNIVEAAPIRLDDNALDEAQAMLREAAQRFYEASE